MPRTYDDTEHCPLCNGFITGVNAPRCIDCGFILFGSDDDLDDYYELEDNPAWDAQDMEDW